MAQAQFFKPPSKADIERRRKMADALMKQGQQPDRTEVISGVAVKQSPLAGLARALTQGVGGYQEGKAAQMEQAKADAARQTMADALDTYNRGQMGGQTNLKNGETISWNKATPDEAGARLAQALMGNEDTAPYGMQAQMGQIQAKQNNANELDLYKQKFPMELELAKQKAMLEKQYGGTTPAAVAIANEIQKARAAGDMQRVNDLLLTGKMLEKGMQIGANGVETMGGFTGAASEISEAKQEGENKSDLEYKPQIAKESATQTEIGKRQGEAAGNLVSLEAAMPKLEAVTQKLSNLGKTATYTQAGQLKDSAMRQLGQPVGEGAVSRTEYMSTIDNEVLPLLRDTFGAQFTQKEGESLKATLGDVNKSPEEKDAALRSFIAAKAGQVQTLRRQTGQGSKIRVSNAQGETFEIDPKDLPDAQAEGFNPL